EGEIQMRKAMIRTLVLGLILGSFSVFGMAKENKRRVTFDAPVTVNGTLVKAGNYEVVFADETGQLTIFKGKKQIAQAPARLEKIEKDNGQVYAIWGNPASSNEPKVL